VRQGVTLCGTTKFRKAEASTLVLFSPFSVLNIHSSFRTFKGVTVQGYRLSIYLKEHSLLVLIRSKNETV
jgi:hypothetical protein